MKKSIIIILTISLLAQFIASIFLFKLEKKYPDFDNNIFAVPVIGQDSPDFYRLSKNIRDHHFFSVDGSTPESFRTPGYPVFLALTGGGYMSILFSILITALSSVLIYLIGKNFLPEKYALFGGILYSISPSVLFHGVVFLSDGLFTFFLILIVYLFIKKIDLLNMFLIGLLIGIASLIRPIGMYLPFVFTIFLFFQIKDKKELFKNISVLFIGFLVVVLPWMNRNYINSKVFTISSITDYNMAFYNIPEFIKYKFGQYKYNEYYSNILDLETKYDFRDLENREILKDLVSDNLKGNFISYTFFHLSYIPKFLISSPIRYISINTGNIYNDFIGINKSITKITILNFDRLYMATISLLAFMSLYFAFKNRKDKSDLHILILLFCLVGYFAVLTGPVAIPRYRLPVDSFVLILALYSIYSIMPTICRRLRLTR